MIEPLNIGNKATGDQLTADEFNTIPQKINEIIEETQSIADRIGSAVAAAADKVGWLDYAGGKITFYSEQGGQAIGSITLSGTTYAIRLDSDTPSSFFVLTSATSRIITVTPSTRSGEIGGSMTDFIEDYTYTLAVDNGNGSFIDRATGTCANGAAISEEIRSYITVGTNRIRLTVTGTESEQTKSLMFQVMVTSLSLTSQYQWNRPFIEGESYAIDGLFFSGNLQKTLYVRIDDDPTQQYAVTFNSGTSYTTTAYSFNMTSHFPKSGTGVHKVELWMAGEQVETAHYTYQMMAVAREDANKVSLVCINDIAAKAVNYDTQTLFRYATYNATRVAFDITATDGNDNFTITAGQTLTVQTQQQHAYTAKLEIDSEATEGLRLSVSVSAEDYTNTITLPVDNSNSYAAVSGARFYLNAANRSNATADRTTVYNTAKDATQGSYAGLFTGFAWSTDGWAEDTDGNKCLVVAAGSTVEVPELRPLTATNAQSLTLEFKFRCANVADYDTPVLTFMDTEAYDESSTNGIILFPTRLTVLTSGNRQVIPQTVQLVEDRILHVVIVLQRGYATTGRNLAHIYINGIQQAVFEYGGNVSFGNGYLRMGQPSADLYLYMMRYYTGRIFESADVMANFLNTLVDDTEYTRSGQRHDNNIVDGNSVSYELCRQAGYNTMVIEMDGDIDIPSIGNNVKATSTVTFQYNDHPEWNVRIEKAPIDGQGTTSMKYYRWNLRWKLKDSSVFTYADGTTDTKAGYLAGRGLHPKVQKITAKKNYASSMQGHKMGATAMYDELYAAVGLKSALPTEDCRIAIYSNPFMGFQKHPDGSYTFIGLYTAGPDKGDKNTFGYDTKAYPSLLQIEGPNHAPLGTRFLHPWTDTDYDPSQETLTFGGQEGWDVDICPYATDDPADKQKIYDLLEKEWRPAYEIVYYCSPFLRSLDEVGMTLDQINADPAAFQAKTDVFGNRNNSVLTLYDSSYRLVYYRNKTQRYETLEDHDMLAYLSDYLTEKTAPTTAQLIMARAAKFQAEAPDYWSIDSSCYHDDFCVLIGATDNHAKNTYPQKFKPLSEGGRWIWKQDDLDSILATDNNGQSTKGYGIEVGDVTADGTDIWQGSSSVFWTLLRSVFWTSCKQMMQRMVNAMQTLAAQRNIQGSYIHETVFNIFDYYFWSHTARYFAARAYNEDAAWSYITPWAINPDTVYNGVYPLTQALGTQYEAERQWVTRRIAYIFSQYEIAAFTGSGDDGYGRIEFTPAQTFTFHITPAIDIYPSGNIGGGENVKGQRTLAGTTCTVAATSDGQTTYYLKALDWYTDIGDLSSLVLTSRGGDTSVGATFAVKSKRLKRVKVGNAVASAVRFNASSLSVEGPCIEEIDARNATSIRNDVSLLKCPRLKRALFEGTNVPTLLIPMGAKVTDVSYPTGLQTLFLHTLPLLSAANLKIPEGSLRTINGIYYYQCPGIPPFDIIRSIFNTTGNRLQFITMIWTTPVTGTSADLDMLAAIAADPYDQDTGQGYGAVTYDPSNNILTNSAQHPDLEGIININGYAYEDSAQTLRAFFGNMLTINILRGYYLRFADRALEKLLVQLYGDGTGFSQDMADQVTHFAETDFADRQDITILDLRSFRNLNLRDQGDVNSRCVVLTSASAATTVRDIYFYAPNTEITPWTFVYGTGTAHTFRHLWITGYNLRGGSNAAVFAVDFLYTRMTCPDGEKKYRTYWLRNVAAKVWIVDNDITSDLGTGYGDSVTGIIAYFRDDQLALTADYTNWSKITDRRPLSQFNADYPDEADWYKWQEGGVKMTDRALYALLARRYGDGTDLRRSDTAAVSKLDSDLFTGRTDIKILDLRSFYLGTAGSVANPYDYRFPLTDTAAGKPSTAVEEVYIHQPNMPFTAYQLYGDASDPVLRLSRFWLTCRYLQGRPDDGTRIIAGMAYLSVASLGASGTDFDTNVKASVLIIDAEITKDWQSLQAAPLAATEVYVRDDQLAAAQGYAKYSAAKSLRPVSQFAADHPADAGWWKW